MTIHEASRTLLKSPPELWTECSDATSLSRHLDQFGEIKITRLEPETAVAWEGENVSGTVKLEPSGWGTRVILTAEEIDPVVEAELSAEPEPVTEPVAEVEPEAVTVALAEPPGDAEPEAVAEVEPPVERMSGAAPDLQPSVDESQSQPQAEPKLGFLARVRSKWRRSAEVAGRWPQVESEPVAVEVPAAEPAAEPAAVTPVEPETTTEPRVEPETATEPRVEPETATEQPVAAKPDPPPDPTLPPKPELQSTVKALTDALESLGMAHHRPFSRS